MLSALLRSNLRLNNLLYRMQRRGGGRFTISALVLFIQVWRTWGKLIGPDTGGKHTPLVSSHQLTHTKRGVDNLI